MTSSVSERPGLVRRGLRLNYLTLAYNTMEALVSLAAGLAAGSVALVGFGIDSAIELTASGAAQWRLRADHHATHRGSAERSARRIIGSCFLVLAAYLGVDATTALLHSEAPERSLVGLAILTLSLLVMPWLARRKRAVAAALSSRALQAEATQTALCGYLSAIALVGVGLNALLGWWWADPVAALAMTPIIVQEGIAGVRNARACEDCP